MSALTAALYPRQNTSFVHILLLIVVCLALALPFPGQPAGLGQTALPAPAAADSQALQLQSGDHLLRFEPGGVSMTGLNHSLDVEFLGTPGVTPRASRVSAGGEAQAYQEVRYAGLWQGITARFSLSGGAIAKSEFLVAPGGNPASIRLRYSVAPELRGDGSLRFVFPEAGGEVVEAAPVAWQDVAGQRHPVPAAFSLSASGEVGYTLGAYDPALPLVIDPDYRWHTFYGGTQSSELVGLCVAGNLYFGAGWTSSDLHRNDVDRMLSTTYHTGKDVVVTLQDAGGYFQKVAHFGGNGDDVPKGMACSGSSIFIVGTSGASWLGPESQTPLLPHSGANDIFILSLTQSGVNIVYNWHTFLGSQDQDEGRGIAVVGSDLYVTGVSFSGWDGPAGVDPVHSYTGGADLVVLNLTTAGAYQWHTFYGSQGEDLGAGIAANASVVWATGFSDASWRGPSSTNPLHAHSGGNDIAVLKLDTSGGYGWHTFYGSSGSETGSGVVLHATSGAGFISAYGNAAWQGDGNTAPLHAFSGGNDITVLALSGAGAYDWHTFYGSTGSDEARGLGIDASNNLYVGGTSGASWLGPGGEAPVDGFAGRNEMALLKLNARGTYAWHAFYGGNGLDLVQGVHMHSNSPMLSGSSNEGWLRQNLEEPEADYLGGVSAVSVFVDQSGVIYGHAFLGTSSDDFAMAITSDINGNILLAGQSSGSWRGPANQNALHGFTGGYADLFLLKLDSNAGYLWHTFFGGPGGDGPAKVITDGAGSIYVLGESSQSWNGPAGQAPLNAYTGLTDIYVLKLDANGVYTWHTFLGGAQLETAEEIVYSGATSSLYLIGSSTSAWNGPAAAAPRHAYSGARDVLVACLAASNGAYQWHAFYGTAENDEGSGIGVSTAGVFALGSSPAWNGPAGQAPLHSHDGSSSNLFALKLTSAGNYSWHTFYGNVTYSRDLALDASSNLYLLGTSANEWLGPAGQTPTHPFAEHAAVILKLNSAGAYQWHGFFGGTNMSMPEELTLYQNGDLWVLMEATVPWQASGAPGPLRPFQGRRDSLVLRVSPQGLYRHHTYLGSSEMDYSAGLAVSPFGQILVGGSHYQSWDYLGHAPLQAFNELTEVSVTAFTPLEQVFLPVAIK